MQLPPLTEGRILRRYKRFLADIELEDGSLVTAHCPNTGRMTGCWREGALAQLSHSNDPKRKLAWTLERIDMGQGWVGVNTSRVNAVVAEALEQQRIPALDGYRQVQREPRINLEGVDGSRLDFLLEGETGKTYIEVKSTTLWDGQRLRFPDAPSERGRKHLELLARLALRGHRAVILYAVNRPEGSAFAPADAVDPAYGKLLREVVKQGVEPLALRIAHDTESMTLIPEPLEITL